MNQEELSKKLLSPSKNSHLEKLGKGLTFACLSLIVIIVAMILISWLRKGYLPSSSMVLTFLNFYLDRLGTLQGNSLVLFR